MSYSLPTFYSTSSGQTTIPIGARAFSIQVVSGSAYANGTLLLASSNPLTWGSPDSKILLGTPGVTVGTTGAANRVVVFHTN